MVLRIAGEGQDDDGNNRAESYAAEIASAQDYYPFGQTMPDRSMTNTVLLDEDHRFGFNGKEQDNSNEWGRLTHYDYGFRIYNPGIAKFMSVDPLTRNYPNYTPYQFAGNSPIAFIDLDGLERFPVFKKEEYKQDFPHFYSLIESGFFNKHILKSESTLKVLDKYSVGMLTQEQVRKDINNGPIVVLPDMVFEGQTTYGSDPTSGAGPEDITIKLNVELIKRFEGVMNNPNAREVVKILALLDIYDTFINEYVQYGDALDGLDAIKDENGNIVNGTQSDFEDDGLYTAKIFDEGNDAVMDLLGLVLPDAKQENLFNIYLQKEFGKRLQYNEDIKKMEIIEDESLVPDKTIIPKPQN